MELLSRFKLAWLILTRGGEEMVIAYATLIINGMRTLDSVPATLKAGVKQALIDLGVAELLGIE